MTGAKLRIRRSESGIVRKLNEINRDYITGTRKHLWLNAKCTRIRIQGHQLYHLVDRKTGQKMFQITSQGKSYHLCQ